MLDISKKIDPVNFKVLSKIKAIADRRNVKFFIVGATVRDMILNYAYNIPIYRATNDIDFAVRVKSWDEYYLLTSEVEETGFRKEGNIPHRYYCEGIIVDFIPFGDISGKNTFITWENKEKKEMNIIGFEDAFNNAEEILVQTNPDIIIRTASVESLVMLKLFSWNDRDADLRIKDARDLYLIMSTYLQAGNEERLYEDQYLDIVEETSDYELSGARLLGRDIIKIASNTVINGILDIIKDENLSVLAKEMAEYEGLSLEREIRIEKCIWLLKSFKMGLEDNK